MFLQTGGGGKGIRPNQQHQQQHHHQSHHQTHHQTHHPHAAQQQQQQQAQTVHHGHPTPQQTHSHHPHQQHQHQHQHSHQQQQSQQQQQQQQQQSQHHHPPPPIAYYSYQLSQTQPPSSAQYPQGQNNAAVTVSQMAPSPPTQVNTVGATSSVSATQSHSLVGGVSGGMSGGGGGGGSNGNNTSATNIARQHAAAVAAAAAAVNSGANMQHYTTGTALMQTPATSTAFMTTTYLQQYQSAAVMAAAAAQYNNNAAAVAAAAANNHNNSANTQTASSMYQQQQQQHHQALHHTQTQLHAHYYPGAGATPTPPPHLHAHHHPQQHQLRGVLTAAPHQRQPQTTYLLPANAIFALPPGPLAAAPRTSLLAASTHQPTANTGGGMSVSPLLQSGARAAAGGPTAYITAPFCQPPLPMGAAGLTPPQPLLATPTPLAQQSMQTYAHMSGAATTNSTSTTSLSIGGNGGVVSSVGGASTGGTETVKPRKHAIPIIHPITLENILDQKPQKKSTAVEAKPLSTEMACEAQEFTVSAKDPTDKSITVSISKSQMPTSTASTETIVQEFGIENMPPIDGCNTAVILVQSSTSKEKIDQQMQTDAVRDRSTSRRVSTYDMHTTGCSPPVSVVSADEDSEHFVYAGSNAGHCNDSHIDCNEALTAYMNEEDQQLSLADEQSGLHATASLHSATCDDYEDSNYDDESTSLMDVVENEEQCAIPLEVYGVEETFPQQQNLLLRGSEGDELLMQNRFEESDISVVTSATTLSEAEEELVQCSTVYKPEQKSTSTVTDFPTQMGQKIIQIEDMVATITGNDNLRASAGADSITLRSGEDMKAAVVAPSACSVATDQLKSSKSLTSGSTETGAATITSSSAPTGRTLMQKHSPNTSGASSSATSTPTHHSYTQPPQTQPQQQQSQQQQQQPPQQAHPQQKKGASTLPNAHNTMASTSGASSTTSYGSSIPQSGNSAANSKKNRKASKRANKESQKKLNKQSEANSQRSNTSTVSSNNSNNNNNSGGASGNNNNNKNTLNNTNNINLNNNLVTKSMTTTTATNIPTDKNNANSFSDSGNLRETTSTANLGQKQQQRSGSVTKSGSSTRGTTGKSNTKSDSIADVHEADRSSPTPTSQQQKPTKHLKSKEIEAQFMQQLEPPPQLQFLNSSSSACEDEEELSARIQLQLQQDAEESTKSFSDLKFGEFEEDQDYDDSISQPNEMKQPQIQHTQSTKSHSHQDKAHSKQIADATKDTVDCTVYKSKSSLPRSSISVGKKSTTANSSSTNIDAAADPLKARKYSLDELKAISKSSEARKPPMVLCQRGDFISQLFVSRQQHHHLTHHAHNMSTLHQQLQQQQYQHMNFNESMELVSGKRGRSGQTKKHHEHQSSGGAMSGVLSVAAVGGSGGAGGIGNVGGLLTAQQQRKVDFIRVQLSLKEDIKLSECENAWQPETLRSKSNNVSPSDPNEDIDAVLKKVRGVLNKLTPDNFEVLLKSMTSISMNTQEKMQQVMLLIFEKTVSEPNFAPTYAKFCKVLFQEIKAENKSLFNSSLINRIQHEFETNVNDANAKKVKLQPLVDKIDGCADSKERLELQAELEDKEYQFRRRAWGTVRFIGEMFKLQSLTNERVFICIESLLEHGSEEKLEYMCKLLTTVGHLLESPEHTSNARMDKIFRKIQDIIHKSRSIKSSAAISHYTISSRVRFMMQDVIDLRARIWDHPQSQSSQSHPQQQQQMMSQQQLSNQRRSALGGKQDDKMQGGASGNMYEKNNRMGNYGGGGGNAGGGGGNQRNYFQKSQKSQQFIPQHEQKLNIDLNKLKFTSDEVTQSTTKLGSPHLYLWRTPGRQTASTNFTSNTPATLLSINTAGVNATNSTGSGFKRQSSMLGATSTLPSLANNPFQALDRQDLYTRSSSPPEQKNKQFSEDTDLPDLKKADCLKMLTTMIEEVLDAGSNRSNNASNDWQREIVNAWSSINSRQQKTFLNYILTDYLHLSNVKRAQRKACAAIFVHLMRTKLCEQQTFNQVYTELSDELPDLLVDVPNLWTYVFEFIGPLLHAQLLNFNDIWLTQWAADIHFTKRFLQALIHYFTSEFGATYTRELWNKEFKLEHGQQFMSDATQWREFINSNGFQYIHDRNYKPTQLAQSKTSHPAAIAEQVTRIEYLLNTVNGCDLAIDYINTNVNINTHFIRSLTKLICCDYATVKPTATTVAATNDRYTKSSRLRQLDSELFRHKCIPLLRRCLDGLETHEIACLDAIVDAMQQQYDTPTANQLICSVFDLIYDSEVIPKESFDKWYRAEQQGVINSGSNNSLNAAAGGHLDSTGGSKTVTKSSTKKTLATTGVASSSKASMGAESAVSSGGARLNEELHTYMEKLL